MAPIQDLGGRLKARLLPFDTFRENVVMLARDNAVLRPERLAGAHRVEVKARGVTILASPMITDDPACSPPTRSACRSPPRTAWAWRRASWWRSRRRGRPRAWTPSAPRFAARPSVTPS